MNNATRRLPEHLLPLNNLLKFVICHVWQDAGIGFRRRKGHNWTSFIFSTGPSKERLGGDVKWQTTGCQVVWKTVLEGLTVR